MDPRTTAAIASVATFITVAWPVYLHFEQVAVERGQARERAMERRISMEYQNRIQAEELEQCWKDLDAAQD